MTAPALPGAAPDPARLPPEVESHVVAVDALLDAVRKFVKKDTPTGLMRLNDAMVAARDSTAALRTAIARALGGDGEPVAWAVFKGDSYEWVHDDEAKARENERDGYRVVPLYTRPAATGDTGEGDGALIGEAFGLIGHVVNHARRSTNIDGTRRRLGDDEACGRNWIALVDKCEALLAARATKGGPDAR